MRSFSPQPPALGRAGQPLIYDCSQHRGSTLFQLSPEYWRQQGKIWFRLFQRYWPLGNGVLIKCVASEFLGKCECLVRSVWQFLWCKYMHMTNFKLPTCYKWMQNLETNLHNEFLGANTSWLQPGLPSRNRFYTIRTASVAQKVPAAGKA